MWLCFGQRLRSYWCPIVGGGRWVSSSSPLLRVPARAALLEEEGLLLPGVFGLLQVGFSEDRSTPMMVCGQWSSSLEAVAGFFEGRRC